MDASDLAESLTQTTIGYLNDFLKYTKNSTSTTVQDSIKFLRWWCNCQPQQEPAFVNSLTKGIVKLRDGDLPKEAPEAIKALENITDTLMSNDTAVFNPEEYPQSVMILKVGIIMFVIFCILYVLYGIQNAFGQRNLNAYPQNVKTSAFQNNKVAAITPTRSFSPRTDKTQNDVSSRSPGANLQLPGLKKNIPQQRNDENALKSDKTQPCSGDTHSEAVLTDKTQPSDRSAKSPAEVFQLKKSTMNYEKQPSTLEAALKSDKTQPCSDDIRTEPTQLASSPSNTYSKRGVTSPSSKRDRS